MSLDAKRIKEALVQAGAEVFRTRPSEVHVAERVRSHLMDSGIRLVFADEVVHVRFSARTQHSDYPGEAAEALYARVDRFVGSAARARGYVELSRESVEVKDPANAARTLDVWHEISFEKASLALDEAVAEVLWLLTVERYVLPEAG